MKEYLQPIRVIYRVEVARILDHEVDSTKPSLKGLLMLKNSPYILTNRSPSSATAVTRKNAQVVQRLPNLIRNKGIFTSHTGFLNQQREF